MWRFSYDEDRFQYWWEEWRRDRSGNYVGPFGPESQTPTNGSTLPAVYPSE
ncbi:hypothetical protein SFOMI_4801 [Sphingobium fuliginis]|uniref:Uncharacterized protein n=1 Tax=Sphingobium fuliginis (strain ATCC 27551) TaxID=336203 RepID=A0A292ZMW7_SPHSA|nr:hypothetical protein SFOMI_4801 [Sphingobium fuliginis]